MLDGRGAITPVISIATALGLFLRLYQLTRPHYLLGFTGYDDGVDFGSSVRLVGGAMPYRDFVFVQPPGITLLMAPVALLGKLSGTHGAFAAARVLTAFAGAASVPLVGLLVRHRGSVVTAVACGVAAVHPDAIYAAHTVLLEPWLVLFCLLGAVLLFEGDRITTRRRRLLLGGIAFGVAGAIKVWAILPVLVLAALCWRRRGFRTAIRYLCGVAAGFAVPAIPFLAIAPKQFLTDVISAQLTRSDVGRVPVPTRLTSLVGIGDVGQLAAHPLLVSAAMGGFVLVSAAALWLSTRGRAPDLDIFVLASTLVTFVALLWPADYYDHYAAFFAPLLALSLALAGSDLIAAAAARSWRVDRRALDRPAALLFSVLAVAAMAVFQLRSEARLSAPDPSQSIDARVPAGACVATDLVSLTLIAGRFDSTDPRCSRMIDPVGSAYALAGGRNALSGAAANRAFEALWLTALGRARFVLFNCFPPADATCELTTNRRFPWHGAAGAYFTAHFRRVNGVPEDLFVRAG